MDGWNWTWTAWFVASAGSFATLEYISLKSKDPTAPLSHQLRYVAGLKPDCTWRQVVFVTGVGGGATWLVRHLMQIPEY